MNIPHKIWSGFARPGDRLSILVRQCLAAGPRARRQTPLEFRHDLDRRQAIKSEKTRVGAEAAVRRYRRIG